MNKKILAVLIILIAVSTISVVSATNTRNIGGVDFNVPAGYTYDRAAVNVFLQIFDDSGMDDVGVFTKGNDDVLAIVTYTEAPDIDYPSEYKVKNKKINGKKGTLAKASDNVMFTYKEDDLYVLIQAVDEDVIKEIV